MKVMMAMGPALTERIIACIFKVHQRLGVGFVEKIYKRALVLGLRAQGLAVEVEKQIPIHYDRHLIGTHVLDIVVNGEVIIEHKTAETLIKAHYAQVRSYLKAADLHVALLVNFSADRADICRVHLHHPHHPHYPP